MMIQLSLITELVKKVSSICFHNLIYLVCLCIYLPFFKTYIFDNVAKAKYTGIDEMRTTTDNQTTCGQLKMLSAFHQKKMRTTFIFQILMQITFWKYRQHENVHISLKENADNIPFNDGGNSNSQFGDLLCQMDNRSKNRSIFCF